MGQRTCKRVALDFDWPLGQVWPGYLTPDIPASASDRLADYLYEAWLLVEPPPGDGWQLWETTSEGSPISPVFDSAVALAEWSAENATAFADHRLTREQWLASFLSGRTDVVTTVTLAFDPAASR